MTRAGARLGLALCTALLAAPALAVDVLYQVQARQDVRARTPLPGDASRSLTADLELTPWRGAEGLQLLNDLRVMAPDVRTILITGYGSPQIEEEARLHGVHAFVRKPVRLGQLEAIVRRLLAAA